MLWTIFLIILVVILPDSSSNDYEYHARLKLAGIDIVLDHHEADKISEDAIVIIIN